jgi:hypothetical protein
MADLNTFLAWFSGYAENIKKQPTPSQWSRIKAEIAKIDPITVHVGSVGSAPPPMPARPNTPTAWKAAVQAALIEAGLDDESAKEMTADLPIELSREPAAVAKAMMTEMMN